MNHRKVVAAFNAEQMGHCGDADQLVQCEDGTWWWAGTEGRNAWAQRAFEAVERFPPDTEMVYHPSTEARALRSDLRRVREALSVFLRGNVDEGSQAELYALVKADNDLRAINKEPMP